MKYLFNFRGCRKFQTKNGKPLWVLQDVCKELNIPRHLHMNAYERLLPNERGYFEQKTDEGERQVFFLVKQSGIYSLILQQKGINAGEFKKWLAHEILPQLDESVPIIF